MVSSSGQATGMVGFLYVGQTQSTDGWIGALMVTDERGYPMEFRATTPVRPSPVQRALWGSSLERYVSVELCGKRLLKESARKPKVVVCTVDVLLDAIDGTDSTMVRVRREGEALEPAGNAPGGRAEAYGWEPIVYRLSPKDGDQQAAIGRELQKLHSTFDLVEVFGRIQSALQILAKEDAKYA